MLYGTKKISVDGPTSCFANLDSWVAYSFHVTSIVDPHWLNTDPDKAFYLIADADPWSQTNVDSVWSWSDLSS